MAYLKSLLTARLISLFGSLAFTLSVVGLSGKALADLHHDRVLLPPYSLVFPDAHIDATDVVGVIGAACAAGGFGCLVTLFSEFLLWKEERARYLPKWCRYINEFLLGFASIFMLAVCIAATIIVSGRSATIYSRGQMVPKSTIEPLLKAVGKSLKYRDFKSFPAMICAWFTWLFLTISFVLVCLAGLHYRKREREGRLTPNASGIEKHSAEHEHAIGEPVREPVA